VAPLATLVDLTVLNLSGNQIVDVAPLATLVNLTVLWLGENQIIDTTPLRSLPETTQIIGVIVRGGCCTIV
jgi:internalin A